MSQVVLSRKGAKLMRLLQRRDIALVGKNVFELSQDFSGKFGQDVKAERAPGGSSFQVVT